ncbi:uncharacterized protein LOC117172630 isoform X2 [Belonocnema kinseyi]|uniref:uncharacterized protein LOC117172630 isoform X2 n=1 Tax=Belonocnema kinseyi TaxID=2817044 RepID=UPI00143D36E3|nr:uncharacterized protein LOC117172630 isoform X2 [Belonocnema kinseyi]
MACAGTILNNRHNIALFKKRKKMASGYQLRSLTAVAEHLDRRKRNWTHDRPSADETDYEEELTDTESEEDADDPAFEPSSAAGCIYLVAGQKDKNCL